MPLWRRVAGLAVLGILIYVGVALAPPYYRNMRFQRFLDSTVPGAKPEMLVASIVNHAAQQGLPLRSGDVKVTPGPNGPRVDIIYVVRVDLPLYTVDLHFHPAAGN